MDVHEYDRHRSLFFSKVLTTVTPPLNHSTARGVCQPGRISGCRLPDLVFSRIKRRGHLPVFDQPPWCDREHAAMAVAVPVGHALVAPDHAGVQGVDLAVIGLVNFGPALDRAMP